MSRSFSGYLLIEDLFDNFPDTFKPLYNEAQSLFNPTVRIVSDDCRTLLGKRVDLDFTLIGRTELSTDKVLDRDSISTMLAAGTYKVSIRTPSHCTAIGGVCRKCYLATTSGTGSASVGDMKPLKSEVISGFYSFNITRDDLSVIIPLSVDDVDRVEFYYNDDLYTKYTVNTTDDDQISISFERTFRAPLRGEAQDFVILLEGLDEIPLELEKKSVTGDGDEISVRAYRNSTSPFVTYLAKTYAGSLLGASPVDSSDLPLRLGLIKERISAPKLAALVDYLEPYSEYIPATYMSYIDSIKDPLERELYVLALYAVYCDVGE